MEVFGTVASTLGVAALFNNCVDCFQYIQLGRHFGRDFQTYQLKVDIAKTRLGRWGEAVNINGDPRFDLAASGDESVQLVQLILEEIMLLFESVKKRSARYRMTAESQDLALFEEKDMKPIVRRLHGTLNELARQRQKSTNLIKKTAWALYDGKDIEKMVNQINGFIDDLEKPFPVNSVCLRLAETEIEGVQDEQSLMLLKDAADGIDNTLQNAVMRKVEVLAGSNYAKDVSTDNSADVQVGNQYSEEVVLRGVTDGSNSAKKINATGTSKVQIGSRFGVRF